MDPFIQEMILDVDQSVVLDSGVIDSPVLGKIPPTGLSRGAKNLILVKFDKDKIFNASTCGDNCAKWLLKIAETEDRTVNLHHLMNFGEGQFELRRNLTIVRGRQCDRENYISRYDSGLCK